MNLTSPFRSACFARSFQEVSESSCKHVQSSLLARCFDPANANPPISSVDRALRRSMPEGCRLRREVKHRAAERTIHLLLFPTSIGEG
jgi:hypothetical protein